MSYKFDIEDSKKFIDSYTRVQNILIYGGFWSVLSAGTKSMFPVLMSHTRQKTGKTFVGIERIAILSGLSKPTVRKGIRELAAMSLLSVKKERVGRAPNYKTRNFYSVTIPTNVLDPNYLNSTPLKEIRRQLAESVKRGENFLMKHADTSGFIHSQSDELRSPQSNISFSDIDDIPF